MNQRRKIDYNKKSYVNPFFRRKRNINISFNKITYKNKFLAGIVLILSIFMFFFLTFSSKFNFKNIEINGLIRASESDVSSIINKTLEKKRFFVFFINNYFLLKKEIVYNDINEKLFFEKIEINKKFPDTLIINIQEKSQSIVWRENEKYYFADIDGYLINELNPLDIKEKKYPIVENKSKFLIDNNKITVSDINSKINYIIKLNIEFINLKNLIKINKDIELEVEKFSLSDEQATVNLKILNGPSIYFNIKQTQEKQLNKLLVIINEKLKNDFYKKEYIDLRYGERVYYR